MGGDERLLPSERVRKRAEFRAIQGSGKKVHTDSFLVFVLPQKEVARARLGITVSKKVGSAHVRNRVKRLIREAFRRNKTLFPPGIDLVFVAKRTRMELELPQVVREIQKLCKRYFAR